MLSAVVRSAFESRGRPGVWSLLMAFGRSGEPVSTEPVIDLLAVVAVSIWTRSRRQRGGEAGGTAGTIKATPVADRAISNLSETSVQSSGAGDCVCRSTHRCQTAYPQSCVCRA